jgi:hypothetical protein
VRPGAPPAAKAKRRAPRERPERRVDPKDIKAAGIDWQLDPETRSQARTEYREERIVDLDEKLDTHAAKAGWDPETTEEVRAILVETGVRIGEVLARADRGEIPWEKVRGQLQNFRISQARQVNEIVGRESFDAFVDDMGFERFPDDGPPLRGRQHERLDTKQASTP